MSGSGIVVGNTVSGSTYGISAGSVTATTGTGINVNSLISGSTAGINVAG